MQIYPTDIVTPSVTEPVTLDEFKRHIRHQLGTVEDLELADYLTAARQRFEFETNRILLTTTLRQWSDRLDRARNRYDVPIVGYLGHGSTPYMLWADRTDRTIPFMRGRVSSITAVRYYAPDGTLQTLQGWNADLQSSPQTVWFPSSLQLPDVDNRPYPVQIDYVAGWNSPTDVPVPIKVAIKQLAGHLYKHRETMMDAPLTEMPFGFQTVVEQFSVRVGAIR